MLCDSISSADGNTSDCIMTHAELFSEKFPVDTESRFIELDGTDTGMTLNDTSIRGHIQMSEVDNNLFEPPVVAQTPQVSLGPRRYIFYRTHEWLTWLRTRRPPPPGMPSHNLYGRRGYPRCANCRKHRQKVLFLSIDVADFSVSMKMKRKIAKDATV